MMMMIMTMMMMVMMIVVGLVAARLVTTTIAVAIEVNSNTFQSRLFHAPTRATPSGCLVLHRTVHALWNLYGNPYRNRAEKKEETVT